MTIPYWWAPAIIADTGSYINGLAFKPSDWGTDGLPIIRIQNLTDPDKPYNHTTKEIPDRALVARGDLLVSWSATLDVFRWVGEDAVLNQHIFKVVPDERVVTREFLFYLLRHAIFEMRASEDVHGSTMSHINRGPFLSFPIGVPSLPEQRRIVAAIEQQFTRLDAAEAALARVRVNLRRYRASVLAAACEGRLVPTEAELSRLEGRSYESGADLLSRVDEDMGSHSECPATVWPQQLPEGWGCARLQRIASQVRNGWSARPNADEGVPILRISAVRPLAVDMNDTRWLAGDAAQYAPYLVEPGDLLFVRYNGNVRLVGVCGVVPGGYPPTIHPDKLIRVRLSPLMSEQFIAIAANVGWSRKFLASRVRTTAGQSGISGSDLKQIPVPVPPQAEQIRIASEGARQLTFVQSVQSALTRAMDRIAFLRQSILAQAFEGKLAGQSSDDEPADMLLGRIRAARATAAANGSASAAARKRKARV